MYCEQSCSQSSLWLPNLVYDLNQTNLSYFVCLPHHAVNNGITLFKPKFLHGCSTGVQHVLWKDIKFRVFDDWDDCGVQLPWNIFLLRRTTAKDPRANCNKHQISMIWKTAACYYRKEIRQTILSKKFWRLRRVIFDFEKILILKKFWRLRRIFEKFRVWFGKATTKNARKNQKKWGS